MAVEPFATFCYRCGQFFRQRGGGFGAVFQLREQGFGFVQQAADVGVVAVEHVEALRQLGFEPAEFGEVVRIFDAVVAVQVAVVQFGGGEQARAVVRPFEAVVLVFAVEVVEFALPRGAGCGACRAKRRRSRSWAGRTIWRVAFVRAGRASRFAVCCRCGWV